MKTIAFAVACLALATHPASAHFKLDSPASFQQQDSAGDPQKAAPCGGAGTATNEVTTLMEGSQIPISITEELFHPGHYRVALAANISSLPADPPVTADTMSPCGSTVIETNPQLPILGDGLFTHTTSFNGVQQTAMVQLPAGMTCDHCTLQVIEFMSNHPLNNPGGCFYHHCATITVSANAPDAGPTPDGPTTDAGNPDTGGGMGGCCDSRSPKGATTALFGFLAVGMVLRRRRR